MPKLYIRNENQIAFYFVDVIIFNCSSLEKIKYIKSKAYNSSLNSSI